MVVVVGGEGLVEFGEWWKVEVAMKRGGEKGKGIILISITQSLETENYSRYWLKVR